MKYSIGSLLFICSVLPSCRNNMTYDSEHTQNICFPDTIEVNWTYLSRENIIPFSKDCIINDSTIYLLGEANGKWLHLYNTKTGNLEASHISRGSEFGELTNGISITKNHANGNISIFNGALYNRALITYGPDYSPISQYGGDSILFNCMSPVSDNRILAIGPVKHGDTWTGRNAFYLLESKRLKKLSVFDDSTYMTSPRGIIKKFSLSPSGKMFASIAIKGGIFELFKISNDSLIRTFTRDYFPLEINDDKSVKPIKGANYGFRAIATTDHYVYALFSDSKAEADPVMDIGIWTWDGKPVKMLKTNLNVALIAPSEDDSHIYCVAYMQNGDMQLCYLEINL